MDYYRAKRLHSREARLVHSRSSVARPSPKQTNDAPGRDDRARADQANSPGDDLFDMFDEKEASSQIYSRGVSIERHSKELNPRTFELASPSEFRCRRKPPKGRLLGQPPYSTLGPIARNITGG